MQTRDGLFGRGAFSALLGLALIGWITTVPALAQDTSYGDRMDNGAILRDRDRDMKDEDWESLDPMPPSYPFAAPASLHLYHWKDYTKTELRPGSAAEAKLHKDQMRDAGLREQRDRNRMAYSSMPDYGDGG